MADETPPVDPAAFIRKQAAEGAREAMMPWVVLAIALAAFAAWRTR